MQNSQPHLLYIQIQLATDFILLNKSVLNKEHEDKSYVN